VASRSWIDALLAPEGQRLLEELSRTTITAGNEISLITRLRRDHSPELVAAAIEQTKLRRRARRKLPAADRMYFTAPALEQASSSLAARHRAHRFAAFDRVADLCCGVGSDAIALAERSRVVAVDNDAVHARLAALNAAANDVGDRVEVVCSDVRSVDLRGVSAAFVDPARRSGDRRFAAGMSEPPLSWCVELADRLAIGIKAAPGLPVTLVPPAWELEFVSESGELKEAVLWSPQLATVREDLVGTAGARRATLLSNNETLIGPTGASVPVRPPGRYLLDPDPAVTRAGLVEDLGSSLGSSPGSSLAASFGASAGPSSNECWKIDDRVAFLSADSAFQTPFARTLRIEASMPWSLARVRDALRALDVGVVDIRKRGSAVDVDELHARLKLRGTRTATVVLTRVADRPWAFICFEILRKGVVDAQGI
jgi:SAM-dependent methyltransferase